MQLESDTVGATADLEHNLIIERVRASMRRAKMEGRHIGPVPAPVKTYGLSHNYVFARPLLQLDLR
jgi:DNA invertase Pin-like site-specific DNA recombinase